MDTMKLQIQAIINHSAKLAERHRSQGQTDKALQLENFGVALLNVLDGVNKKD